jgi:argininosuccinate lyase
MWPSSTPMTILPGFTHLQVAQPVSFAHHLLAYVEMFARDAERMGDDARPHQPLALGVCGSGWHHLPAGPRPRGQNLGHGRCTRRTASCAKTAWMRVSDRDFAIEFTAAAHSVHGAHQPLERRADFVDEPKLCASSKLPTASPPARSIMPQKKNPDVPELARGKTGRVVGHLMGLITLMKGQPLAYNKDNQEDKEPLV